MTMRELIKDALNKGLTQRELAEKIGFSHSTIQKILFTNTKCTYETRKKVADYFRVPVAQFYDAVVDLPYQQTTSTEPPASYKRDDPTSMPMRDVVAMHGDLIREMQRTLNHLIEKNAYLDKAIHDLDQSIHDLDQSIIKHGTEIGRIRDKMDAAAQSGDINRLWIGPLPDTKIPN